MIPALQGLHISSTYALAEALGRPVSDQEGLATDGTVVAHWSLLDYFTDEDRIWSSVEWAQHLDDANREHPFAATYRGDPHVILHVSVRLHPKDRVLTPAEWSEVGHRLARVSGIAPPGDPAPCRWIAIRDQSYRLDLVANLIREDGVRAAVLGQLLHVLAAECRRIEADLGLLSPLDHHVSPFKADMLSATRPTTETLGSSVVAHLSDEAHRHLDAARRLVEKAAQQLGTPSSNEPGLAHQLEWIARRTQGLDSDLSEIIPGRPRTPATGPVVPLTADLPADRFSRIR
ncbi:MULTISPECIES: relaxase/mobilization nuclease [Streptomyces]|uniref:relaxase/mobilization nuclease n=1 Tax=Streptomyces TaxID=1883 RepID=UPI0022710E83|nr:MULTISPECIES: relaxase/mobilization nuclease [unclassified Streptomyces]MCY0940246.1 relaxase/mobilization nuclease [Streptomyces sp. H34-AA3]MCZ4080893.1 relaxase/mobilization nuclease [Streptomyces sp. H34-S5]